MNRASPVLLGGVEAGGTKFVCVAGTSIDDVRTEAVARLARLRG